MVSLRQTWDPPGTDSVHNQASFLKMPGFCQRRKETVGLPFKNFSPTQDESIKVDTLNYVWIS